LAIFSAVFFSASGQVGNKDAAQQLIEIANEAYYNLKVILIANEQYAQAAEMDPDNIEANYMAGKTFLETNFKDRATKYFLRVLELDPSYKFNIHFLIGQTYQYGLQYSEAFDHYDKYLRQVEEASIRGGADFTPVSEVERKIFECQNGLEYLNEPRDYVIENLGPEINSEWDDYGPVLTADEKFIAFTTRRQEGNSNSDVFDDMLYYEDVFYSTKIIDKWQPARNIGPPINNIYHSSNLAISADGSQLYLYRSQNGGDVFLSEKNSDGSWSEPEPLNAYINSSFSENSVSISPDGSTLYFSSDRPITPEKTDLDIYYSKKNRRGDWGPPVNISAINTEQDEDGVFIDYDGKTLYFSSRGHRGMGGFDIYKSVYDEENEEWSAPVNLGYPMNSPDNDIYFVSTRDGKRGYFASSKADGYGFMDIYHIKLADLDAPPLPVEVKESVLEEPADEIAVIEEPKPVVLLLKTVDKESENVIEAEVTVADAVTNLPVAVSRIGVGMYQAEFANESAATYKVTVQKAGYMYQNADITIPGMTVSNNRIARQVKLDKVQPGFSRILRNIYFDYGTARLKDSSGPELQKLLKVIQQNPEYIIEISGHTDNFGGKEFNQWLSERRAQAVVDYMVKKGEREGRFLVTGYGEDRPIASNDDEESGRELNRRVEFKVLRFIQ
jgi:outer membrane protein OmpA-like peptidoglycan-associated protein